MSTLDKLNASRKELIKSVTAIFDAYDFNTCCNKISELIHDEEDKYNNLSSSQRAALKENLNHAEYSVDMHRQLFQSKQNKSHIEKQAKEVLEIEIIAVLRSWPEVDPA